MVRGITVNRQIDFLSKFGTLKLISNVADLFIQNSNDLYIMKVKGDSMINSNIQNGSIIIVKKQHFADDNDIVIAEINGLLLVKTYKIINNEYFLYSTNPEYEPIKINNKLEFKIKGIVKYVVNNI